jgi:hypothetical protein
MYKNNDFTIKFSDIHGPDDHKKCREMFKNPIDLLVFETQYGEWLDNKFNSFTVYERKYQEYNVMLIKLKFKQPEEYNKLVERYAAMWIINEFAQPNRFKSYRVGMDGFVIVHSSYEELVKHQHLLESMYDDFKNKYNEFIKLWEYPNTRQRVIDIAFGPGVEKYLPGAKYKFNRLRYSHEHAYYIYLDIYKHRPILDDNLYHSGKYETETYSSTESSSTDDSDDSDSNSSEDSNPTDNSDASSDSE